MLALRPALVAALVVGCSPAETAASDSLPGLAGVVRGVVISAQGTPVADALVLAGTPDLTHVFGRVTAGPAGSWDTGLFQIVGLPLDRALWVVALDANANMVGVRSLMLSGRRAVELEIRCRFPLSVRGVVASVVQGLADHYVNKALDSRGTWQELIGFLEQNTEVLRRAVVEATPEPPAPPSATPAVVPTLPSGSSTASEAATIPTRPPADSYWPPSPASSVVAGAGEIPVLAEPGVQVLAMGDVTEMMGSAIEVELSEMVATIGPGLRVQVLGSDHAEPVIAQGSLTTGEGNRYVAELTGASSLESIRVGSKVRVIADWPADLSWFFQAPISGKPGAVRES